MEPRLTADEMARFAAIAKPVREIDMLMDTESMVNSCTPIICASDAELERLHRASDAVCLAVRALIVRSA